MNLFNKDRTSSLCRPQWGGYKRDKMMEKKLGFISYNKSGWLTLKFEPANTLFNTLYGGKGSGVHKFESL